MEQSLHEIQGIIFELDSVLFDKADWVVPAIEYAAGQMRIDPQRAIKLAYDYISKHGGADPQIFNFVLLGCGQFDTAMNIRAFTSLVNQFQPASRSIHLYPGVEEAILRLSGQYKLAVVTDGSPDTQKRKVMALGLHELIRLLIYSDEIEGIKSRLPDPRPLLKATGEMNLRPNQVMFVGHNPMKHFMRTGEMGFTTVRVLSGEYGRQDYMSEDHRANFDLPTVARLPELLDMGQSTAGEQVWGTEQSWETPELAAAATLAAQAPAWTPEHVTSGTSFEDAAFQALFQMTDPLRAPVEIASSPPPEPTPTLSAPTAVWPEPQPEPGPDPLASPVLGSPVEVNSSAWDFPPLATEAAEPAAPTGPTWPAPTAETLPAQPEMSLATPLPAAPPAQLPAQPAVNDATAVADPLLPRDPLQPGAGVSSPEAPRDPLQPLGAAPLATPPQAAEQMPFASTTIAPETLAGSFPLPQPVGNSPSPAPPEPAAPAVDIATQALNAMFGTPPPPAAPAQAPPVPHAQPIPTAPVVAAVPAVAPSQGAVPELPISPTVETEVVAVAHSTVPAWAAALGAAPEQGGSSAAAQISSSSAPVPQAAIEPTDAVTPATLPETLPAAQPATSAPTALHEPMPSSEPTPELETPFSAPDSAYPTPSTPVRQPRPQPAAPAEDSDRPVVLDYSTM